ncbi:hypothetical protein GCM10009808_16340 [Microbacterium sediminicola]|uniref:HTH marR-type domain-containing protein n=1 Tax=Microbacterium sediminicola TaxID=415210 RepID=A0ABP4U5G7_9MICO
MTDPIDPRSVEAAHRDAVRRLDGAIVGLVGSVRRYYIQLAENLHPGMLPGTAKLFTTIARTGPTTLSALVEVLTADKGMLSRQVSELEGLGLIARTPDPNDRRARLISITAEGAQRLDEARLPYEQRRAAALAAWPTASIEQFADLLNAFISSEPPGGDTRSA